MELFVRAFLALGGDYLRQLDEVCADRDRVVEVRKTALLSRYVGVLRFFIGRKWLLDLVLDTTDVKRERAESPPLILATGRAAVVEQLASEAFRPELGDRVLVV